MGIKKEIKNIFGLAKNKETGNNSADSDKAFQRGNTTKFFRDIQKCENDAQFFRLFDPNRAGYDKTIDMDWKLEYTNKLRGRAQISNSKLAEICGVNLKTANSWKDVAPKKRENYVAISCVFGLGVSDCSRIMNRFGGYEALDEKNPNDIVYIRLLQISERPFDEFSDEKKRNVFRDLLITYEGIKNGLDSEKNPDRINAYAKLEELGDTKFAEMYKFASSVSETRAGKLHDEIISCLGKMGYSSKDAFFKEKRLHSMYPKAMSNMSRLKDKIIPKRNLLISLFLHMALPLETINRLLGIVNMEPLCSKNPYESALIHVLSQLYKKHPELEKEKIMLSSENGKIQERLLKDGSLYMFVHTRLMQKTFAEKFERDEIDLNECMCRKLSTDKENGEEAK